MEFGETIVRFTLAIDEELNESNMYSLIMSETPSL